MAAAVRPVAIAPRRPFFVVAPLAVLMAALLGFLGDVGPFVGDAGSARLEQHLQRLQAP
ncbi:MAG TPA: hypothetical protein VIR57_19670 [Chloroflexota bacterium]